MLYSFKYRQVPAYHRKRQFRNYEEVRGKIRVKDYWEDTYGPCEGYWYIETY